MRETTKRTISVIGGGGWGTALALHSLKAGHRVRLKVRREEEVHQIKSLGENRKFLPGVPLPEELEIFWRDEETFIGADMALMVVPSAVYREVARTLAPFAHAGLPIVSCTKGIERGTGRRMSEILAEEVPGVVPCVLSGPSHAEEVARGMPTAVCVASPDPAASALVQRVLNHGMLRIYTSPDPAGLELGGALKNIFAIAAGIGDGLDLGDNTKAALVTRSLAEMIRLGTALGGRAETFQGLGGVGDLMVTCFSRHSRNRHVGERLGRGESLEEINATMKMVAEGVPTTRSAVECASSRGIETPVIDQIHKVLFGGKPPAEALSDLMTRAPKSEY